MFIVNVLSKVMPVANPDFSGGNRRGEILVD